MQGEGGSDKRSGTRRERHRILGSGEEIEFKGNLGGVTKGRTRETTGGGDVEKVMCETGGK